MNNMRGLLRAPITTYVSARGAKKVIHFRATMNDLPQPCGDWKTQYDYRQRKWNVGLLLSSLFLFGSVFAFRSAGLLWFNATPPECPADRNIYE